jgi:hypothetical protein
MKEVNNMPPPEEIGQVGTVKITYHEDYNGVTNVRLMSKADFGRLATLVGAYAELDRIADQLHAPGNLELRKKMAEVVGWRLPSPHRRPPTKKFDFTTYTLKGFNRRAAVEGRKVKLEPKYIKQIEFVRPVGVSN